MTQKSSSRVIASRVVNKFLIFAVLAEKGKVLLGNVGNKDPLYLLNPAKVEDQDFEMTNNKILSGPQSATSSKLYHLPHLCELDYFTAKIFNGHIDIG